MSWYRQQLETFLSGLDVKADTVIDIGGKQGNVKGRTATWWVKEYKVLDLPEFNIEDDYYEPGADLAFVLEVFEYLIDPFSAMYNLSKSLKPGGHAMVTYPLCYPVHNEVELDALRYTEPGIRRLAEAVNLKVNNVWYRRDKTGYLQSLYAEDGMHPAKGYDHSIYGYIVDFVR